MAPFLGPDKSECGSGGFAGSPPPSGLDGPSKNLHRARVGWKEQFDGKFRQRDIDGSPEDHGRAEELKTPASVIKRSGTTTPAYVSTVSAASRRYARSSLLHPPGQRYP